MGSVTVSLRPMYWSYARLVQTAELRLWVRTRTTTRPDRLHRLRRADLSGQREMEACNQNSSISYTIDACVSKSSGSQCEIVGRVSRRLTFTCPRAHTGSASHLHLCNIAVWHVQKMATVITVCVQTCWASLLPIRVFAQAISVQGQIVCLTNTLPLHIQTCLATLESMVRRPLGTTGVGLLPRSNTRKNSYSGWNERATRGYQCNYGL